MLQDVFELPPTLYKRSKGNEFLKKEFCYTLFMILDMHFFQKAWNGLVIESNIPKL